MQATEEPSSDRVEHPLRARRPVLIIPRATFHISMHLAQALGRLSPAQLFRPAIDEGMGRMNSSLSFS